MWNLLHVALIGPRILGWFLDFWKMSVHLLLGYLLLMWCCQTPWSVGTPASYSRGPGIKSWLVERLSCWNIFYFFSFPRGKFRNSALNYANSAFFPCFQINLFLIQGCTNPGRQVAVATKFCAVAPNICGSSVWNLLLVISMVHRILRLLLDFWKVCAPLLWWSYCLTVCKLSNWRCRYMQEQ